MDPALSLARRPKLPTRGDVALAAVVPAWALLDAFLAEGPGPDWLRPLFAVGIAAPLLFRRQAPLEIALFISALVVARAATSDVPETGTMPFPCILVAIFSVALYARSDAAAIGGGVLATVATFYVFSSDYYSGDEPNAANYLIILFFIGGAWTAGWLVRKRAAALEVERATSGERARQAVSEERARIARELHDVVAHSVSIISVQAGAAGELIGRDDDGARAHLETVRRTSHDALTEMRRLLDVLRTDEAEWSPQPTLDRLDDLVAEARDGGVPAELTVDGDRGSLSPGVELAAYRIVQEALTNVRKHASGAPTDVLVSHGPAAVEIRVVNRAPAQRARSNGSGGGHGLAGMSERVRVYGGTLRADHRPDGGFEVCASLPREGEPA